MQTVTAALTKASSVIHAVALMSRQLGFTDEAHKRRELPSVGSRVCIGSANTAPGERRVALVTSGRRR